MNSNSPTHMLASVRRHRVALSFVLIQKKQKIKASVNSLKIKSSDWK